MRRSQWATVQRRGIVSQVNSRLRDQTGDLLGINEVR